uniref:cytochrome-c oxidase n=1 Tax=Pseudochorda nagaii TaxID=74379 RepID=A0A8F0K078_9PHAE|nr:cytochrome oxidase subunit II [Pseudochorda nagaii]
MKKLYFVPRLILLFIFLSYFNISGSMDAAHPWQVGFQDPATPIMEGIIFFNGLLMTFMLFIACLVGWLLYKSLTLFNESVHPDPVGFNHSTLLEVVWTIIPAGILMIISVPSYNLLYAMDEVIDPSLTIKVVGHQWYWSYECSDFEVDPKILKDKLELANTSYTNVKTVVDNLEASGVETDPSEKSTQIVIMRGLIDSLSSSMQDLPEGTAGLLAARLNFAATQFIYNEGQKESYGFEECFDKVGLLSSLSTAKDMLGEGLLLPAQEDFILNILKTFKMYLRLIKDSDLEEASTLLMNSLDDRSSLGGNSTISSKGDFGDKGLSDNDDGSDEELDSIISELNSVDEVSPIWKELALAKEGYEDADTELTRAAAEVFNLESVIMRFLARCITAKELNFDVTEPALGKAKVRLAKALIEIERAEDNLIDTQLIAHKLRLTRTQREGYSSEFNWDSAGVEHSFANIKYKEALAELENAKASAHWAKIDLAAANVNKLTAAYFQADAELGINDPAIKRSGVLLKGGYPAWTKELRLEAKVLLESDRLKFIKAEEELKSANALLYRAQADFTPEELMKTNAIANRAEADFMAIEKDLVSVMEEYARGAVILSNAESDLKTFESISERADNRLEKAQLLFDKVKSVSDRTQAQFSGADILFKKAQEKLFGGQGSLDLTVSSSGLDSVLVDYDNVQAELFKSRSSLAKAKTELTRALKRSATVESHVFETQAKLDDTPILYDFPEIEGADTEYFENYLWEIHYADLFYVNAQLKSAITELKVADTAFANAENHFIKVSGHLIEAELKRGKELLNFFTLVLEEDVKSLLNAAFQYNSNQLGKEALHNAEAVCAGTEVELAHAEKHLRSVELDVMGAISNEALANFKTSKFSQMVFDKVETDSNKISWADGNNSSVLYDVKGLDPIKAFSEYGKACLKQFQKELVEAEFDYVKARNTLEDAARLLESVNKELSDASGNIHLQKLCTLFKDTTKSLNTSMEYLEMSKTELSPLDVKLDSGLMQTRSCMHMLRAKEELAYIKWLAARVSKTLNTTLTENVKPFNTQFEDGGWVPQESSSEPLDSSSLSADSSAEGKPSGKKEEDSLKDALSTTDITPHIYTVDALTNNILAGLTTLLDTVGESNVENTKKFFSHAFSVLAKEEQAKNKGLIHEAVKISELMENGALVNDALEGEERQRINFDSYLIAEEDLVIPEVSGTGKAGKVFRLLEVDNRLVVPTNTHIRVLVTSADVLHSWAVPSLGVKVDACPGRLNQVFIFIKREGVFYGQCSELCGVNHGFMPIVVQAVSQDEYLTWVGKRLCS